MYKKIYTFITNENKMNLIFEKINIFFQKCIYKRKFNYFGRNSLILKASRIIGGKYVTIGENVRILHNLRLEVINAWQGEKFDSKIVIGDNVSIGQNFHITSAENLIIGKNTTISGNVFITNIDHNYENIDKNILSQNLIIKHTEIGENCFIGYGASIQAGTILGKQCIVGTNAVVRGKFDDFSVIVGVPAKVIKKYNFNSNKWERVDE